MKTEKTVERQRKILASNIDRLLKENRKTQTDMARDLELAETTVSSWLNGKRYPRIDKIQMMADYFGVRRSDITEEKPTNIVELEPRTVRVPILGKISCGDPITAPENIEGYIMKAPSDVQGGNHFVVIADGESMAPTIPHGAFVTIREQPEAENGQIVAALVNGDSEVTLKRFRRQGNTIMLTPDNPAYDTIIVDENHPVKIVGIVKGFEVRF